MVVVVMKIQTHLIQPIMNPNNIQDPLTTMIIITHHPTLVKKDTTSIIIMEHIPPHILHRMKIIRTGTQIGTGTGDIEGNMKRNDIKEEQLKMKKICFIILYIILYILYI